MNRLNEFMISKLNYKAYLLWKTHNQNIRSYNLKVAKMHLECARAFLNVERRRINQWK